MTMERSLEYGTETIFDTRSDRQPRFNTGAFPATALNTPMFEGKDIAGIVAATIITLGPLAAYSLGWGA